MGAHDYRVLIVRAGGASRAERSHLIREDAEAALCGIPRSSLGPGTGGELVCADCTDWLAKRKTVSLGLKKVSRPTETPET